MTYFDASSSAAIMTFGAKLSIAAFAFKADAFFSAIVARRFVSM